MNLLKMFKEKTPKNGRAACRICGEKIDDEYRIRLRFDNSYGFVNHEKCVKKMYKILFLNNLLGD